MNFEAHITIPREHYDAAKIIADKYLWHMSNITDDEVMGPGPKAYITHSDESFQYLFGRMNQMEVDLRIAGIPVLRKKIEAILIDETFFQEIFANDDKHR